jgi:hypothetical protein
MLVLKLALILTLIFAVCIGLIRAQPYDDSELRAFLTPPDGCPMPCFMGVRPGVTTADEAIAILEAHEWVEGTNFNQNAIFITQWTGLQPNFVETSYRSYQVNLREGVVSSIAVTTTISAADIQLLLGVPTFVQFSISELLSTSISHTMVRSFYSNNFLQFDASSLPCPLSVESFWKSYVTMLVLSEPDIESMTGMPPWDRIFYKETHRWC